MSEQRVATIETSWQTERFKGITRPYTAAQVDKLRGTLPIEHTLARHTAEKLWDMLKKEPYIHALGAQSGMQAVQMVAAGLKAIYLSGWQVAADANLAGETYPDQSLYPANSGPALVRRINNALARADQIQYMNEQGSTDWFAPIVADIEAGFGGALNTFEVAKSMIIAGAAGIHIEDQLASEKKCGHLGGKVLLPTELSIRNLVAARLAADVLNIPTIVIARTDADSATLLTSDIDSRDTPFITGERTREGYFRVKGGLESAIAHGLSYAPYADLVWCETAHPDLSEAQAFAQAIHDQYPNKMLAYNCSPSFNWEKHLDRQTIARFQEELGTMGYKFQFVTLAGFHSLNHAMFELAREYRDEGMAAYSRLQQAEFESEPNGYNAVKHQSAVGAGYFDEVAQTISGGLSSTTALTGSTEVEQF